MMVTLARGIALPRGTGKATYHTKDLTRGIFNFFFKKKIKIKKYNFF